MRRFWTFLGLALIGFAVLPTLAQAQVIYVQPARVYAPPVYVNPPVVTSYYYAPSIAQPSVVYPSTYSYYSAPPVVSYSAPPVVTYSAPNVVYAPAPGYYETRTYYGYGIFRPRGYYSETYYRP